MKTRERVERKTTAGDAIRSAKSGSAAWRMGGAMRVVAAVVAGLDVVVGREREKGKRRAGRKQARLVLWPSSYRKLLPQGLCGARLCSGACKPTLSRQCANVIVIGPAVASMIPPPAEHDVRYKNSRRWGGDVVFLNYNMHSQNKEIAGIDTETTNIEPGTRRWAVDSIGTKQWRPKAMLPLIGCRSLFVAALESFLKHPVLQLVTIRRKELRTQERRGVIDVVFLRL